MKKLIRKILNIPNDVYNWMILKYRHVAYGKNLNVQGRLHIISNTPDGITIGEGVNINSCRNANPIGGDTKTIIFAKGDAKIRIGNGCGMSNVSIFACQEICIGNNVMLGGAVKIYDTDFHWLNYEKRITEEGGNTKPVIIKDGVFIGAHSIILKGVTIGERSIIGAGSVVTKNIPSGEIWAGNPARFIKKVE